MKKLIALLVVCGLVMGLVGVYTADAAVAKKKVVKKKVVKKAVKKIVKPAPAPVAPPPPMVVPPPPPPPVARPVAPAPTGLFGWGLNTAVDAGMIAGMVGLTGSVILPDPMGLGPMVGLPANAVMWKLGAGYAQGKDKDSQDFRAPHLLVEGLINLPADMMGGIETYVGGGLNYIVGRTAGGSYGGEAYVGVKGDLGLGGKTYGQLGLGILRTGALSPAVNSRTTGFALGVVIGQTILL
ncbi:MAG: hypothetical protein WC645_05045 [Candidatus Margulisiibacteriota bacterium]